MKFLKTRFKTARRLGFVTDMLIFLILGIGILPTPYKSRQLNAARWVYWGWHYAPVLPNPPSPRSVLGSVSDSLTAPM